MSNKKTSQAEDTNEAASAAPVPEQADAAGTPAPAASAVDDIILDNEFKIEEQFTVGEWAGMPNYECKSCPMATLDKTVIEIHVWEAHRPEVPTPLEDPDALPQFTDTEV